MMNHSMWLCFYFDRGTPLGLLTTSICFALKRPELADDLRAALEKAQ
jgi:UTP--glucose-1-phosphate uridylyltransferase